MISSSPEVSSTAQLAQVRTETLYGVKRRMNLRLVHRMLPRDPPLIGSNSIGRRDLGAMSDWSKVL